MVLSFKNWLLLPLRFNFDPLFDEATPRLRGQWLDYKISVGKEKLLNWHKYIAQAAIIQTLISKKKNHEHQKSPILSARIPWPHQPGLARRRLAWRLHLGRVGHPAGGRSPGV
jgi:hypothetical protein